MINSSYILANSAGLVQLAALVGGPPLHSWREGVACRRHPATCHQPIYSTCTGIVMSAVYDINFRIIMICAITL